MQWRSIKAQSRRDKFLRTRDLMWLVILSWMIIWPLDFFITIPLGLGWFFLCRWLEKFFAPGGE